MNLDLKSKFVDEFEKFGNSLNGESLTENFQLRKIAFENFKLKGFPTIKNEEWKYTNISFLNKLDFVLSLEEPVTNITKEDIKELLFDDLNENLLVFIDGFYFSELSVIKSELKNGLYIGSISEALKSNLAGIELLGKTIEKSDDSFTHLNNVYYRDGAYINIPENMELTEPIHILNIIDARQNNPFVNTRNLIIAGNNSRVKLVETYHQFGNNSGFSNNITEIIANSDSIVDYNKFQNDDKDLYQVGTTQVIQEKRSVFHGNTVTIKGKFVRNNLNSFLNDEHCESNFNGFYFLDNKDFVDNHTLVDHAKPNCNSNENYKGIIDDEAKAVFNGKIMVWKDAQKTIAYQSNKNILLSDNATVNTKPQLEIFADDVKCSHGATSGNLDETQLFYLRARGISEDKAKALLLYAFSANVIDRITIPVLKENIKRLIAERLNVEVE